MRYTKKIYDSVHGFIRFNDLEGALIDALPFQRLHQIHQVGAAFMVYPGATHTRFEHSLGVMEVASRMFDQIISKYTFKEASNADYWKQIVRFAALCHDLGHLPFSHSAEKVVLGEEGHEAWSYKIIKSTLLQPVWDKLQAMYPSHNVVEDILKIAVGKGKGVSHWEKIMSQLVTADFFGADRIDYLLRDAQCTGLAYGIFDYHQLLEAVCILPSIKDSSDLELGIEENGIQSCEALLLARHFMHERVYQHAAVKAYSFHVTQVIKDLFKNVKHLEDYLSMTDSEILATINKAARDPSHPCYIYAQGVLVREKRFKAVELPSLVQEEDLIQLKERLSIPNSLIGWELTPAATHQKRLNFPVLKGNGKVVDASELSEIVIPSKTKRWVYIAREFEMELREAVHA